jgi:hypothetical protein
MKVPTLKNHELKRERGRCLERTREGEGGRQRGREREKERERDFLLGTILYGSRASPANTHSQCGFVGVWMA